jgi:hypothetical protein
MYCNSCGQQNSDNVRFCASCGAPVSSGHAAQQPSQPTPQTPNRPQTNYTEDSPKLAYASLGTMIGGIVCLFLSLAAPLISLLTYPAFIVSIVLGISSIKNSNAARGCALGGMITSIIMLTIFIVYAIVA